jgi:hypothetical protein
MDRLSDHRFMANYFRLCLHAAAMNLLVRLRRIIAEPLTALAPKAETASPTSQPGEAALPADRICLPLEALTGGERQRHLRLRRRRETLGESHPCTYFFPAVSLAIIPKLDTLGVESVHRSQEVAPC